MAPHIIPRLILNWWNVYTYIYGVFKLNWALNSELNAFFQICQMITISHLVENLVVEILIRSHVVEKEVQIKNEDYFQNKRQIFFVLGYFKIYP